jgi:hypothetical protein
VYYEKTVIISSTEELACVAMSTGQGRDFERHVDFGALMRGARREPPLPVGMPAIVRHLAFWIPGSLTLRRQVWVKEIEDFIIVLCDHLHRKAFEPLVPSLQKKQNGSAARLNLLDNSCLAFKRMAERKPLRKEEFTRYQTFRLGFKWQSMPVQFGLEMHDEFFTLTTVIDLSLRDPSVGFNKTDDPHGIALAGALTTFHENAVHRYEGKNGNSTPQALKAAYDIIYYNVWNALREAIFAGVIKEINSRRLGSIFVDFRSLIASRTKALSDTPGVAPTEKIFSSDDAARDVGAVLPFMKAYEPLSNKATIGHLERVEYTFSRYLGDGYIYGSALGAVPRNIEDKAAPLTYLLLCANDNKEETGRLVDTMHMLGTTRLAALYNLPHIIRASFELRKLEREIEDRQARMQGKTKKAFASASRRMAEKLPSFGQRLAEIGQGMEEGNANIIGGLAQRVERSRYHQGQFDGLVRDLAIRPIEGYPTYDWAVRRRLGGIYDFINTVGHRYERLQNKLTALNRQQGTSELLSLTKLLTRYTKEIDTLQKNADTALFVFLFPYYASSFLLHFYDEHHWTEHWKTKWLILIGSIVVGVVLAARKRLYRKLRELFDWALKTVLRSKNALIRWFEAKRQQAQGMAQRMVSGLRHAWSASALLSRLRTGRK